MIPNKNLPASRLPMRNWNAHASAWAFSSLHASRLPMRNWNLSIASAKAPGRASRLPMRNWNTDKITLYTPETSALPDYLWGIETPSSKAPAGKPPGASRLPMRNWNRDMTLRRMLRGRFQTTYEELKPPVEVVPHAAASASRLPMRNWNPVSGAKAMTGFPLPDYLWGIETVG